MNKLPRVLMTLGAVSDYINAVPDPENEIWRDIYTDTGKKLLGIYRKKDCGDDPDTKNKEEK